MPVSPNTTTADGLCLCRATSQSRATCWCFLRTPLSARGATLGPLVLKVITHFGSKLLAGEIISPHTLSGLTHSAGTLTVSPSLFQSLTQSTVSLVSSHLATKSSPKPGYLCRKSSSIRTAKSTLRLLISQPLTITQDSCTEMVDSQSQKTQFSYLGLLEQWRSYNDCLIFH